MTLWARLRLLSYWTFGQPRRRLRRYFHCLFNMFDLTPRKPGGKIGQTYNAGHCMTNFYYKDGTRVICCSCGKIF